VAVERTMTVTVTGIDKNASSISFTGPNGWKYDRRVVEGPRSGDEVATVSGTSARPDRSSGDYIL